MDHLSDTLAADRYPADRGMPLADFECPHGSLPSDSSIECDCFAHDILEDLMQLTRPQAISLYSLAMELGAGVETIDVKPHGAMGTIRAVVTTDSGSRAYDLPSAGGRSEAKLAA